MCQIQTSKSPSVECNRLFRNRIVYIWQYQNFKFCFPLNKQSRFRREKIKYRKLNVVDSNVLFSSFSDIIDESFFSCNSTDDLCNVYNSALQESLDSLAPLKTKQCPKILLLENGRVTNSQFCEWQEWIVSLVCSYFGEPIITICCE